MDASAPPAPGARPPGTLVTAPWRVTTPRGSSGKSRMVQRSRAVNGVKPGPRRRRMPNHRRLAAAAGRESGSSAASGDRPGRPARAWRRPWPRCRWSAASERADLDLVVVNRPWSSRRMYRLLVPVSISSRFAAMREPPSSGAPEHRPVADRYAQPTHRRERALHRACGQAASSESVLPGAASRAPRRGSGRANR